MLDPKVFLEQLRSSGISFTTGVPDSLLKDFCACIADDEGDIIAANEGGAVALAIGHHLATGGIPLVYMQNSGFGNTVNPLLSLADQEVYSIPILLLIGWRGEPGVSDEPQHVKQGRISEALLESMEINYDVLSEEKERTGFQVQKAISWMQEHRAPYALLVKKGTFSKYLNSSVSNNPYTLSRESTIEWILEQIGEKTVVVSTTGKSSREVFEIRERAEEGHQRDFLTVGGMGHASQIALGIAMSKPTKKVLCLDGDGATLMHMGSLPIIGNQQVKNFLHVVINNGCHESVGGQPTVGFDVDFLKIAKASGYRAAYSVQTKDELNETWKKFVEQDGPVFLEIRTSADSRPDLGRPTKSPRQNKEELMNHLRN